MNKLILLGNGFDLAHGLPTTYNDFILWYVGRMFKNAELKGRIEDDLMYVERNRSIGGTIEARDLNDYVRLSNYRESFSSYFNYDLEEFHQLTNFSPFRWKIKSNFLHRLIIQCCDLNWVVIENEYYSELLSLLPLDNPPIIQEFPGIQNSHSMSEKVHILNDELSFLTSLLHEYLKSLSYKNTLIEEYKKILFQDVIPEEFVLRVARREFNNTMVVNFNYTNTIEQYYDLGVYYPFQINNIHGNLKTSHENMIFGFGDELDKKYQQLEDIKTPGFLDKMKSFGYFKNSNYFNLIRFIQSDDYQVYILGHSCGLSDRTMLNMIFESEFCKSIKIFYHNRRNKNGILTNNFDYLTQEISRHFVNKRFMRNKIVPFDKTTHMPQWDDK